MRLPLIPPQSLSDEQRPLYESMRNGIANSFSVFESAREDGALMGPWNPWLHEPRIGKPIWDLSLALVANAVLPGNVRELVILVVGARFNAAYELYAHGAVAETQGVSPDQVGTLVAGVKPADLTPEESIAFDLSHALARGGVPPDRLYSRAVATFGQRGANEIIYLVGLYSLVSTTLNGFNVPVPES
jgi:alkylhydroperoxidase family enzyme